MACGKNNKVFTPDNNNCAHFVANEEKLHEIYELLRVKPPEHFLCIFQALQTFHVLRISTTQELIVFCNSQVLQLSFIQTFYSLNRDRQLPLPAIIRRLIIQESVQSTWWDHNVNFVLLGQTDSNWVLTHNLWGSGWVSVLELKTPQHVPFVN